MNQMRLIYVCFALASILIVALANPDSQLNSEKKSSDSVPEKITSIEGKLASAGEHSDNKNPVKSDDADEEEEEEEELLGEGEQPAPTMPPIFLDRPIYKPPSTAVDVHFTEAFETTAALETGWIKSEAVNPETSMPRYTGEWKIEEASQNSLKGDLGLVLKNRAAHHALAAKLRRPFEFVGKPLIVQYEVKFQNGQECGGAYVKLLAKQDQELNLKQFDDKTPYTIMFGPDKCGKHEQFHFIYQHKSPVTGRYAEKQARKPSAKFDDIFTDQKTHLFTLVVKPENEYEIYLDQSLLSSGSLLTDVTPPVNPPATISDPDDKKPDDWDDREKIPNPEAVKPENWDETEPELIPDPEAVKPAGWLEDEPEYIASPEAVRPPDWDDDVDGEWEAPKINNPECEFAPGCGEWKPPTIQNPDYKGPWVAPLIKNPDYDGKWVPRMIPNPEYFDDKDPYKMTPIVALGLELWSISDEIFFDNFIVTDNRTVADQWAEDSWRVKRREELRVLGRSVLDVLTDLTYGRPWVWVLIALAVLLPVTLFFCWCCRVTGAPNELEDFEAELDAAYRKRTDAATPDDEPENVDDSPAASQTPLPCSPAKAPGSPAKAPASPAKTPGSPAKAPGSPVKASRGKADLETRQGSEGGAGEAGGAWAVEGEQQESDDGEEMANLADEETEDMVEDKNADLQPSSTSARRRKPKARKD